MKKLLSVFFFYLVIILIGSEVPSEFNKGYYLLEKEAICKTEFIENSMKIAYISNLKIEDEKNRILNEYKNDFKVKFISRNSFLLEGEVNIQIDIWSENGKVFVEGIIDNFNSEINSRVLEKYLSKLIYKNTKDVEFFNYYKGKIKNKSLEELKKSIEEILKEYNGDFIQIENGYTGKIKFKNGTQLNCSFMKYDTGTYLIIGTPIIFKAY